MRYSSTFWRRCSKQTGLTLDFFQVILIDFKDILDHIKTIKPKMTIFEIKEKKTKNSDLSNAANVMRQLKSKNSHIIEKFKGKNSFEGSVLI